MRDNSDIAVFLIILCVLLFAALITSVFYDPQHDAKYEAHQKCIKLIEEEQHEKE